MMNVPPSVRYVQNLLMHAMSSMAHMLSPESRYFPTVLHGSWILTLLYILLVKHNVLS